MVAPGLGLDSSRAESSIDLLDDLTLGSRMDSFQSPGGDDILKATKGRRGRTGMTTPARQILGSRGAGKNEFTPLLQSVQRSNLRAKIIGSNGRPPTPPFLKKGAFLMDSPQLPHAASSDINDDTTYQSREETVLGPPDLSINSTPMAPLPRGRGGVLEHDGQMTLREQEKVGELSASYKVEILNTFFFCRLSMKSRKRILG